MGKIINYLAIIPARGGSKRIPNKNLVLINKKPLIYYTIKAALGAKKINEVVVSTDNLKIATYAKKIGATVPFLRPAEIAQDKSLVIDALSHAAKQLEEKGEKIENIILLQPTSIFRTEKHLTEAIKEYERLKPDTLTSVSEAREHPYYGWRVKNKEIVPLFGKRTQILGRHALPEIVFENGAIYIFKRALLKKGTIYGKKIVPYFMDEVSSLDIDTIADLKYAQYLKESPK